MAQTTLSMLPDLRALRTTFLEKQLTYAMSYQYALSCAHSYVPGNLNVRLRLDPKVPAGKTPATRDKAELAEMAEEEVDFDCVFHVIGDQRVPGLDGLGHEVPVGFRIRGLDESVGLYQFEAAERSDGTPAPVEESAELSYGSISGRMILCSKEDRIDGELLRIAVSYDGTLQPKETIATTTFDPATGKIFMSAFVIPFFETRHPKYHWLTESACLAFGTWELDKGVVKASFDVYLAR